MSAARGRPDGELQNRRRGVLELTSAGHDPHLPSLCRTEVLRQQEKSVRYLRRGRSIVLRRYRRNGGIPSMELECSSDRSHAVYMKQRRSNHRRHRSKYDDRPRNDTVCRRDHFQLRSHLLRFLEHAVVRLRFHFQPSRCDPGCNGKHRGAL